MHKHVLISVLAAGLLLASCGTQTRVVTPDKAEITQGQPADAQVNQSTPGLKPEWLANDQLFAKSGALKSQGFVAEYAVWDKSAIAVCFENPEEATELEINWMREAADRTWARFSQLHFVGWGKCTGTGTEEIRIQLDDSHPRSYVGRESSNVLGPSMWINNKGWCATRGVYVKGCLTSLIAHEFGHALGFQHEQLRDDTPATCQAIGEVNILLPAQKVGEWDLNSVMNYCNPNWNNFGRLTATDKEMVSRFYGAPLRTPDFDALFYINNYPDVKALVGGDQNAAYQHWKSVGQAEGRRGAMYFDPQYYLQANPDVKALVGDKNFKGAAEHWINKGMQQGRRGSYEFDARIYLLVSPDVRRQFGSNNYWMAINHFMDVGLYERRQSSADFMIGKFIEKNPLPLYRFVYPIDPSHQIVDEFMAMVYWTSQGYRENRQTR